MKKAKMKICFKALGFYFLFVVSLCLSVSDNVQAQTGGTFQIENSSIASGGSKISGGNFTLDSTAGQTLAGGQQQGSTFFVQNGFWTFDFAPTATSVSISGRITTFGGQGIQNVRVVLTSLNGETKFSTTSSFGYYRFDDVTVGETYILTVISKRFAFDNPTQIVTVSEELNNLDFVAIEQ